jgi:putative chitinase
MPITTSTIKAIMPQTTRADVFLGPLNAAMVLAEINTPLRIAMFLAHIAHESTQLNRIVENLNDSEQGLLDTFPSYFNASNARDYARQKERIANHVYANRLGNGDEASGEGWRYRGRGLIQVTGKSNYGDCGIALVLNLVEAPEQLEQPIPAAKSAAWFWKAKGLNTLADAKDIVTCTKRINGGTKGLKERKAFYESALAALSVSA